jgi:uncharacterized protein YbaR (Trm112 family)
MPLDYKLLEIIACPVCKGKLHYDKKNDELICRLDRLAYPIDEGIAVLISDKARPISSDELPK